jgi:hypothetical protein
MTDTPGLAHRLVFVDTLTDDRWVLDHTLVAAPAEASRVAEMMTVVLGQALCAARGQSLPPTPWIDIADTFQIRHLFVKV